MISREQQLAELAVHVGANVQAGQDVVVLAFDVDQAPVARAVAEAAYASGAHFVSVVYWDQHVKRSRLEHAPEQSLEFIPEWWLTMISEAVARQSALIIVWGNPHPSLLDGISSERLARDHMPLTAELFGCFGRGELSWTFVPGPCAALAEAMLGTPDVNRLWEILTPILRLDTPDPRQAWEEHVARLQTRVEALERHEFDAVRFYGAGTDLTVGLLKEARWLHAGLRTRWGRRIVVNMPSEEVFTTPDNRRTEGVVRVTRPVRLLGGGRVEELTLRFERGRVLDVRAPEGADLIRAEMAVDEGAARLGEVALVDGSSPVGRTGTVFGDVLIDENATCHIAWGHAYAFTIPELPDDAAEQRRLGFNVSAVHQDVMIGGPEVQVFGLDRDGAETPVIADDVWVLS
jgi:aminopeptidase